MIRLEPRKALAFSAATATLLVLGGCWDSCEECADEKDIVYAWDVPESQADCATNTIFTDDTPQGGDLGGTGIVDRGGTGIVDRDGNLVKKYCKRPVTLWVLLNATQLLCRSISLILKSMKQMQQKELTSLEWIENELNCLIR